jgi:hypothetical protein
MALSKDGMFYLGKIFDPAEGKLTEKPLTYEAADLTTHAVVTGMTGSGKTGLCIGLLEEAALEGIPAITIDPKGDLTNLLLHFPDLLPSDFQPWIDPEAARREGKPIEQMAEETAARWKTGLADWGLGQEQLIALQNAVEFGIFTPGSSAGISVNILSSFAAPDLPWDDNREILREKISTIVTALLGLIGLTNIDPLRSREHILLSNIIETAWSSGKSLDLTELIMQVQKPPFERLGAFPVENFFPEKDRFSLAMLLNNFLASPSFEIWREGQPLDIGRLLFTPSGKPRHSVFYLAHLSESERMFFVTMLFASIESWMRSQRGTSGLRALVYMDEIYGYIPPVENPPSRQIILRMLKQARAFGVGMLLATQNPVDVDYKGLSNAGTWLIGRLQTERDKLRLLDGLDSAGGGFDRRETERLISGLGKRVFLLHNVHAKGPQLFQTRWVLNFLAGPLTRSQIPELLRLPGVTQKSGSQPSPISPGSAAKPVAQNVAPSSIASSQTSPPAPTGDRYTTNRPVVPSGIEEYFAPNDLPFGQALTDARITSSTNIQQGGYIYRPALLAQAEVNYLARKYNLEFTRQITCLPLETRGRVVDWADFPWRNLTRGELTGMPIPGAQYAPLPGWLSDARQFNAMQSDFIEWVYRTSTIRVRTNEKLKVYAGPEVSTAQFRDMCAQAARDAMQAEVAKVESTHQRKLTDLENRIKRQSSQVQNRESSLSQRRMEELGTHGQLLASLLGGRKRSISSSMTKRRMTTEAKNRLEQEKKDLDLLEKQFQQIEAEHNRALKDINDRWADMANDEVEVPVTPYKKDIYVVHFGVTWLPYYVIGVDNQRREIPAYKSIA